MKTKASLRNITAGLLLGLLTTTATAQKYVGGDISLLTKYEENGSKYFDYYGKAISSPLAFFKAEGMNAMRVRLFVDPSKASSEDKGQGVCQDLAYVKALGKRIKEAGLHFMLDLHYSDSWADPAKQWTPSSWLGLSDEQLYTKIYDYTKDVLTQLNAVGATPDFIQTGNEISYGMLWGKEGSSANRCYSGNNANWGRFTTLLKNAGKACREVCPNAKIVIHTERAANTGVLRNFYTQMDNANLDYDIIGLSYYSYFHGKLNVLESALNTLETSFPNKKIMIVEAGYPLKWAVPGTTIDYTSEYPYTDAGQKKFTDDLIALLNKHPHVNGLFWWWMEANEYGRTGSSQVTSSWYNAPLFDNQTGRATSALSEMRKFITEDAAVGLIEAEENEDGHWYTIDGRQVSEPTKGIYIHGGKKQIVR